MNIAFSSSLNSLHEYPNTNSVCFSSSDEQAEPLLLMVPVRFLYVLLYDMISSRRLQRISVSRSAAQTDSEKHECEMVQRTRKISHTRKYYTSVDIYKRKMYFWYKNLLAQVDHKQKITKIVRNRQFKIKAYVHVNNNNMIINIVFPWWIMCECV